MRHWTINVLCVIAIILLVGFVIYNRIYGVTLEGACQKTGLCYYEGAVVLDPDNCCGTGTINQDTVNNRNIYEPTYTCGPAPLNPDPNYDSVGNCYKSSAVRANKGDCCSTAVGSMSTNKDGTQTYIYTCT